MIEHQFYPTPYALAVKAKNRFQNRDFVRVLEPSAGRGDLLEPFRGHGYHACDLVSVDCIEADFDNQAVLKKKNLRIVGHDFLRYESAAMYSHIVMNPPFNQGAEHVLHAWKILFHGEIVAILNAETIKNPCTRQRELLCKLIQDHGSVEYLQEQFVTPETQRKTSVEVALVYLKKESGFEVKFLENLKSDKKAMDGVDLSGNDKELAVSNTTIEDWVHNFDLASKSLKQSCMYRARAAKYVGRFDRSIVDNSTSEKEPVDKVIKWFNEGYDKLKERAWSTVLRSSKVSERLSSGAQKSVEAEFKTICNLDFTVANIYGFLQGIIEQQGNLQISMICEVFDNISRYHPENRVWYCGWKSNAKHRVNAFRIMHTRFILPRCSSSYSSGFSWEDNKRFQDFDKVFALLDGKHHDDIYGLSKMTSDSDHYKSLVRGERVSSDYFELRYYNGKGSLHFFPKRKDLIDRLNRLVGKYRQWLPADDAPEETEFWQQYDKAEAINKRMGLSKLREWGLYHGDEMEKAKEAAILREQFEKAIESMGIKYDLDSALPPSDGPVALPKLDEVA